VCQNFASVGVTAVEKQVTEEILGSARLQARQDLVVTADAQPSKQANA
jgi:hypothetical protein